MKTKGCCYDDAERIIERFNEEDNKPLSAKEMFKKIGWAFAYENNGSIAYQQDECILTISKFTYEFKVCYIDKKHKEQYSWVDMPTLKAITQQMKELGWIDEN